MRCVKLIWFTQSGGACTCVSFYVVHTNRGSNEHCLSIVYFKQSLSHMYTCLSFVIFLHFIMILLRCLSSSKRGRLLDN